MNQRSLVGKVAEYKLNRVCQSHHDAPVGGEGAHEPAAFHCHVQVGHGVDELLHEVRAPVVGHVRQLQAQVQVLLAGVAQVVEPVLRVLPG